MKTTLYLKIFLVASCVAFSVSAAAGQDNRMPDAQPPDMHQPPPNQPQDVRGNMLRQLGLSREQFQQIRRMNAERRPMMEDAQRRFREANGALDAAIYADQVNEVEVQARLKDVLLAQAEVQRLRYMNELAVRRLLTPEQLVRFRELRERFEQARENFENRRRFNDGQPGDRQMPGNDVKAPPDGQQPAPRVVRQDQRKPNL